MTTTHPTDSAAMTAAEFRCLTEYLGLDQRAVARVREYVWFDTRGAAISYLAEQHSKRLGVR